MKVVFISPPAETTTLLCPVEPVNMINLAGHRSLKA